MFFFHAALAVSLFYLINWLGRHSAGYVALSVFVRGDEAPALNFMLRVCSPTVYIILVGSLLYAVGMDQLVHNLHFAVLYYLVFRLLWNILWERARLLNWPLEIARGAMTFLLALAAYKYILVAKRNVVPDFSNIANDLWLLIAIFIYEALNRMRLSDTGTLARKMAYLDRVFSQYEGRYGVLIGQKAQQIELRALIYGILIMEAFNRPHLIRWIERAMPRFGRARTLGLMQVRSENPISDDQSVELGVSKLVGDWKAEVQRAGDMMPATALASSVILYELSRKVAARYNRDDMYVSEVMRLTQTILGRYRVKLQDAA
jgi:hypothetical protein